MATTHFAFGAALSNESANPVPAMQTTGGGIVTEALTPSGSNQQTTGSAPSATSRTPICRIATDTQVYVSFGSNPNASSDTVKFLIPANAIEYFYVKPGDKAAVVNG